MSKRSRVGADIRYTAPRKRGHSGKTVKPGYTRREGLYGRTQLAGEKKYLDTSTHYTTPLTVATGGTIVEPSLNLIAQGASFNERIGTKVRLRNINSTVVLRLPVAAIATDASDCIRLIWYIDHQANGLAATPGQILQSPTLAPGAGARFDGYRTMTTVERFTILKDKLIPLNAPLASATQSNHTFKIVKFSWKGERILHFDNSVTTLMANVRSDNVGVLAISYQGDAQITMNTRIKFSE